MDVEKLGVTEIQELITDELLGIVTKCNTLINRPGKKKSPEGYLKVKVQALKVLSARFPAKAQKKKLPDKMKVVAAVKERGGKVVPIKKKKI